MNFPKPVRKKRGMQRGKRPMTKAFVICALALVLAGCAPTPEPEPPVPTVPGIDPATGQPFDLTPGLNDLEPDVCKGSVYSGLIGQPAAAVASAGITAPVRVVPLGSLITEEYSSARINFYLDGAGNIAKISCG
jgi:Peptidase inhibitor I78 family